MRLRSNWFAQALTLAGSTPEQLAAFRRPEMAKWARIVTDSGARLDRPGTRGNDRSTREPT